MSSNRHGWPLVAAFAAVAGASQLLWLTYAPVTTEAAEHYGVSVTAIGWLANVFPLLYVVLAVPAGLALDRRPSSCAVRSASCSPARVVSCGCVGGGFGWALAGQLLVGVAQPFVLNAITGVVGVLPVRSRPTGIAVGSAGLFLGMVLALGMGAALAGGDRIDDAMAVQAVLALVAAGRLPRGRREGAPARGGRLHRGGRQLAAVWRDPVLRRLALLAFLGFGVFVALVDVAAGAARAAGCLRVRGRRRSSPSRWLSARSGRRVVAAVLEGRPVEVALLRTTLVAAVAGCACPGRGAPDCARPRSAPSSRCSRC